MKVTTPQAEIYEKLQGLGWNLAKIELKNGTYVAKGANTSTGQSHEGVGKSPELALVALVRFAERANKIRTFASALRKFAAWSTNWLDQKEEIAQAYSKMPVFDEKAVPAWQALAAESRVQADAIRQQIKVEVVDDPEPYHTAQEMAQDIHQNKRFKVSRANSHHPVWTVEDNLNFRIVHDVLGHGQSGGDFSWRGENLACGVHFPLVSPLAREALFTDCIGQTAYYSYYRGFGPQKVGFLSQFLHPVQQQEGEHIWVPHGGLPNIYQGPEQPTDQGILQQPGQWVNPQFASPAFMQPPAVMQGFDFKSNKSVSVDRPHDPNAYWVPQHQSQPLHPERDMDADYIDLLGTFENAAKIDTDWQNEDEATQKRAIMNAFRVALLSPRKHLKWNAAHYQALMHADPNTRAVDLWHMLEAERERHNQELGYPEGSHLSYKKQLDFLVDELQEEHMNEAEARKEAKSIIFHKTKEFEELLAEENEGTSELKRYNMARKMVDAWLKENYTPARGWQPGQLMLAQKEGNWKTKYDYRHAKDKAFSCGTCSAFKNGKCEMFDWAKVGKSYTCDEWTDNKNWKKESAVDDGWRTADTLFDGIGDDLFKQAPIDMSGFANADSKFGAFMGAHLDAIEKVGQHIDEIQDLAKKDLDEGGKGFIFRNGVMNMNLPGVNPKVASFAWLLLAPLSSELGIVDTHVLRGLRRTEADISPRDYYKMERMQRAAKDATGYGHVPLGLYHWGLWDQIRNPGSHSDHSPLRVLDPVPWKEFTWDAASTAKAGPWAGPIAFENARGHIENAAVEFEKLFGDQPRGQVPIGPGPSMHDITTSPMYSVN